MMENGKIHVYCGDGKGKTTAAMGLALRAHCSGEQVFVFQFMKDGASSETQYFKENNCYLCAESEVKGFYSRMNADEQACFKKAQQDLFDQVLNKAAKMADTKAGGLIVLDEITYAYRWELIEQGKLLTLLREKPKNLEIVLTGRDPDEALVELADYVSEICKRKHPFDQGVSARKGIEY